MKLLVLISRPVCQSVVLDPETQVSKCHSLDLETYSCEALGLDLETQVSKSWS